MVDLSEFTDKKLEADYRRWWAESYGIAPNQQAVKTAVAWSRQLVAAIAAMNPPP
jgi:hypothetical protein